jgi:hypothetical protein
LNLTMTAIHTVKKTGTITSPKDLNLILTHWGRGF